MSSKIWFRPQAYRLILSAVILCVSVGFINPGPVKAQSTEFNNPNLVATLIHNTVLALNQANLSGNYTVLRDLGSPQFREVTTSAQLAVTFLEHRKTNLDMSAVVLFRPQLRYPAQLTSSGQLRIVGFYPTKPLQINFDLTYQITGGKWRIFRISVSPSKPAQAASNQPRKAVKKKLRILPRPKPGKTADN